MVKEDALYYYIRYCNLEDSILIRHVPIFNRGDFFEINSMAKRSIELIETVDMMFNEKHDFGTSKYLSKDIATDQFFRIIASKTLTTDLMNTFVSMPQKSIGIHCFLSTPINQISG